MTHSELKEKLSNFYGWPSKKIVNVAKINEDPKDSMIREMKEKIK